jgi:hypothetical protein
MTPSVGRADAGPRGTTILTGLWMIVLIRRLHLLRISGPAADHPTRRFRDARRMPNPHHSLSGTIVMRTVEFSQLNWQSN